MMNPQELHETKETQNKKKCIYKTQTYAEHKKCLDTKNTGNIEQKPNKSQNIGIDL